MSERGLPVAESSAVACPFVAFEDERDERSTQPDHRHRCYAELRPAPRALAHQETFCLTSAFPACPTFQDWARREAARERQPVTRAQEPARDPFASRAAPQRSWAAPPPWLGDDEDDSGDDGGSGREAAGGSGRADPSGREGGSGRAEPSGREGGSGRERGSGLEAGSRDVSDAPPPGFLDRRAGRPAAPADTGGAIDSRRTERQTGRGLADVDPERPWLPAADGRRAERRDEGRTGADLETRREGLDRGELATPNEPSGRGERWDWGSEDRDERVLRGREWRAGDLEEEGASSSMSDELDDDAWEARSAGRQGASGSGVLDALAGSIGSALGRDRRPRVGAARARGAADSDRSPGRPPQARIDARPNDPAAPAWERPRRLEAYPTLKTRIGLPAVPPVALGCGALAVAAVALFLLPLLLFRPNGGSGTAGGPTPTPTVGASASAAVTPTPAPTADTYTVKAGDTLSAIAKRLGVTLDELLAANPQIKDPNKIGLGDQVNIPSRAPTVVTDASPSNGASASP